MTTPTAGPDTSGAREPVVVVGLVPHARGRAALAHGIRESQLRGARLVVVNSSRGNPLVDQEYLRDHEVADLTTELAASGVPFELRQPVGREVAEELTAITEETAAELLVIGIRHRSAVGKMLMGSAAQRILLDVDCPVLAVKGEPEPA